MLSDLIRFIPSKHALLDGAAYFSLFLTIAHVLWPKLTEVLASMWVSFRFAVREVRLFLDELKQPVQAVPPAPPARSRTTH